MRLCLDEHHSPTIAEKLRRRGRDVYAVAERPDLRALPDRDLWAHVQSEHRALLTENIADFTPFVHEAAAAGDDHWGLVLCSPHWLRRTKNALGAYVQRLDAMPSANAQETAFRNSFHWLE